jgi:hypothetical protein
MQLLLLLISIESDGEEVAMSGGMRSAGTNRVSPAHNLHLSVPAVPVLSLWLEAGDVISLVGVSEVSKIPCFVLIRSTQFNWAHNAFATCVGLALYDTNRCLVQNKRQLSLEMRVEENCSLQNA